MDPWPSLWPVVVDLSRGSAARPEHAADSAATAASVDTYATSDSTVTDATAAAAADTYPDPDPAVTDTDSDADFDADADAGAAGAGLDPVVVSGVWEVELGRVLSVWWRRVCPGWVDPGWAQAKLSVPVRGLLMLAPGPELIMALSAIPTGACPVDHCGEELPGIEPVPGTVPGWACACQVVVAAGWEACASWTQTRSAAVLVATAGAQPVVWTCPSGVGGEVVDAVAEELAPALRLSPASMGNRIAAARRLAAVPELTALVAEGLLGCGPARWIADDLALFPADDVAAVTVEVAQKVRVRARSGLRAWTGTEIRAKIARALLALGSAKTAKARQRARRGRRVQVSPAGQGMAWLNAYMSEVDAARVYARLTAIANGIDDPDRGMDAKRCDLLTDALLATGPTTHPEPDPEPANPDAGADPEAGAAPDPDADPDVDPDADPDADAEDEPEADLAATSGAASGQGRPPPGTRPPRRAAADICVVVNLTTLLGLDDDPGEVVGVGPIPAVEARILAADGLWRAWITDAATGAVIDTGRRVYTPSAAVARLVRAREPYCRMPGCRRRAVSWAC